MKKSILIPAIVLVGAGALVLTTAAFGNVQVPEGITVVKDFDVEKYAGKWYEIARFDFKFEKDVSHVTAEYQLKEDGSIKVINKGFNYIKNEWQEKEGKAKFVDSPTSGALKVSFFGPFYGGYNVVSLDNDYNYALVFGESNDYIWILSRTKTISEDVKAKYLQKAKDAGYDLDRLVWTKQE